MGKIIKLKNEIYIANEMYKSNNNEVIIGKYLGKTLYRRVFGVITINGSQEFGSLTGIDRIVKLDGIYQGRNNGDNAFPLNVYINNNYYLNTWCWITYDNNTKIAHLFSNAVGYIGYDGHIIIEYTKQNE